MKQSRANAKPTQAKSKSSRLPFALATACAAPFALSLSLLVLGFLTQSKELSYAFLFSGFVGPILLLPTVAELILVPLAWAKSPRSRRPLLVIYVLVIAAYWKVITLFGESRGFG